MAEDKRITRKGVRQMMRPKPRRVTGRDPYKPPPMSDGGTRWFESVQATERHTDAFLMGGDGYTALEHRIVDGPPPRRYAYANLAHLKLVVKRRRDKAANFVLAYGAGADYLLQVGLYGRRPWR